MRALLLVLGLCASTFVTGTASATPEAKRIEQGQWGYFCTRNPNECRVSRGVPRQWALTPARKKLLEDVNTSVNLRIVYTPDSDHWGRGVTDNWDLPTDGKGDCEDQAIQKRHNLIAAGWPRENLALAWVSVMDVNEESDHLVLLALTDDGEFVLDNRSDKVVRKDAIPYNPSRKTIATGERVYVFLERQPYGREREVYWVNLPLSVDLFEPAVVAAIREKWARE